jgi:hypothetical protein
MLVPTDKSSSAYTWYRTLDKDGKIPDSGWLQRELQEHEKGNCEATKGIKF